MKPRSTVLLSLGALLSLATFFGGCIAYQDKIRTETQSIEVTSDPPGAMITIQNEDGTRKLGPAPVWLSGSYEVVERKYNKGSCALTGAAALSDAVTDDDGHVSDGEAALGLIGMVVGAAAGAASCSEADGIVAIRPTNLLVNAHLAGFLSQQVSIQIPKKKSSIHFELVSVDGPPPPRAAPAVDARPAQLVPNRIAVFDLQSSEGQIEPQLLSDLSAYLTAGILDAGVYPVVLREELLSLLARQESDCSDLECRTRAARALGAEHLLDTRIVKTDTVCLVSCSIIHTKTHHQKLIAATQATCDRLGLMAAMDTVTELLVDPPEQQESPSPPPDVN